MTIKAWIIINIINQCINEHLCMKFIKEYENLTYNENNSLLNNDTEFHRNQQLIEIPEYNQNKNIKQELLIQTTIKYERKQTASIITQITNKKRKQNERKNKKHANHKRISNTKYNNFTNLEKQIHQMRKKNPYHEPKKINSQEQITLYKKSDKDTDKNKEIRNLLENELYCITNATSRMFILQNDGEKIQDNELTTENKLVYKAKDINYYNEKSPLSITVKLVSNTNKKHKAHKSECNTEIRFSKLPHSKLDTDKTQLKGIFNLNFFKCNISHLEIHTFPKNETIKNLLQEVCFNKNNHTRNKTATNTVHKNFTTSVKSNIFTTEIVYNDNKRNKDTEDNKTSNKNRSDMDYSFNFNNSQISSPILITIQQNQYKKNNNSLTKQEITTPLNHELKYIQENISQNVNTVHTPEREEKVFNVTNLPNHYNEQVNNTDNAETNATNTFKNTLFKNNQIKGITNINNNPVRHMILEITESYEYPTLIHRPNDIFLPNLIKKKCYRGKNITNVNNLNGENLMKDYYLVNISCNENQMKEITNNIPEEKYLMKYYSQNISTEEPNQINRMQKFNYRMGNFDNSLRNFLKYKKNKSVVGNEYLINGIQIEDLQNQSNNVANLLENFIRNNGENKLNENRSKTIHCSNIMSQEVDEEKINNTKNNLNKVKNTRTQSINLLKHPLEKFPAINKLTEKSEKYLESPVIVKYSKIVPFEDVEVKKVIYYEPSDYLKSNKN